MKYDTTPEERHAASAARWALAGFVLVGLLAALFIATDGRADAAGASSVSRETTGWTIPRCAEDQVITRRGRCIWHDDNTSRFQRVTSTGAGYWWDVRHPNARYMRPLVPACRRYAVITRYGRCVNPLESDFRHGYWYGTAS